MHLYHLFGLLLIPLNHWRPTLKITFALFPVLRILYSYQFRLCPNTICCTTFRIYKVSLTATIIVNHKLSRELHILERPFHFVRYVLVDGMAFPLTPNKLLSSQHLYLANIDSVFYRKQDNQAVDLVRTSQTCP